MRDAVGVLATALVLGGDSDIANATVRLLVERGTRKVVLAGRDMAALERRALTLRRAGLEVVCVEFDAADTGAHEAFVDSVFTAHGDVDMVLLAFGVLGNQEGDEADGAAALRVIRTNFEGAVSVAIPVSIRLRQQAHGALVVLSSVAADRPRRTNFIYGSAKAGMDAFFQGLSDSMVGSGVTVSVVRPGFVATKMTEGMPAAPFSTTPEAVAAAIVDAVDRGRHTVYVPAVLGYVMGTLKLLPRPIFRRLKG
ncbi:MAG: SDR family NAD(P)-dependent oxidoreductase [Candidatus Dormibacteria bacterium]